ncbi:MAG: AraC family transcriptional regulator [Thermoflexibacteraceae bacterium]|jgi:AraC family L-rhamnose operon regulatory protein RhaS
MKTFSLFQEFDVTVYEADKWEFDTHRHTFFEIIYILEGKGVHLLNDNHYVYGKDSLFLLSPDDYHKFDIQEFTKFCIITFNKVYFSREHQSQNGLLDFGTLLKKLELIFSNVHYLQNEVKYGEEDIIFTRQLLQRIIVEHQNKAPYYESILQNSIFLLLGLIARHLQLHLQTEFKQKNTKSEISDMLLYIQHNIYDNDKLTIEAIADHFLKSKNYISLYFKAQTGTSLKDYILNYKLTLAKNRLLCSHLTISEIAYELGFTDDSHLNKLFKKKYQKTAKQYKMDNQQ